MTCRRGWRIVRIHWQIENELHWVLDVIFDEDQSRVRIGYAQKNLALLLRVALSLLKQDSTTRSSIKVKRKRAGWDDADRLHVLTQWAAIALGLAAQALPILRFPS